MLVDNFVKNINAYRQRMFVPGDHLEADETVIRWYGVGGGYVNKGLPMYLALERKPDNVARSKILPTWRQGSCCG
jgi:hypothetical protein